jgi:hypothetical protein
VCVCVLILLTSESMEELETRLRGLGAEHLRDFRERSMMAARAKRAHWVHLQKRQMCEGCGLKRPGYGLTSKGEARWCAGCAATEGAVRLEKPENMCEGCGLKQPTYGLAS